MCLNRAPRKLSSSSSTSPLALYGGTPYPTIEPTGGVQTRGRVISFLCRHRYGKRDAKFQFWLRPFLGRPHRRSRVPHQGGPRCGCAPLHFPAASAQWCVKLSLGRTKISSSKPPTRPSEAPKSIQFARKIIKIINIMANSVHLRRDIQMGWKMYKPGPNRDESLNKLSQICRKALV